MNEILCLVTLFVCLGELSEKGFAQDFGYDGTEGPTNWGKKYHQCVGKHQSPINIEEHDVEIVNLLPMTYENFDQKGLLTIINNGHTALIKLDPSQHPTITGGPLIGKYKFSQLHFHWGATDYEGSENKINNSSFPMELHIVFYSSSYGSVQHATEHPDGLCVLSFLFARNDEINENYREIIKTLSKVIEVNTTAKLEEPVSLEDLLTPDRSTYFTYGGSLTTPPCSEVVTWIEYKHTIPLAHEQMEAFRHLNSIHGKLIHNFRPPQPLHGRVIRMNRDIIFERSFSENFSNSKLKNLLMLVVGILVYCIV